MTILTRIALAVLALIELVIGAWNQFWPENFFANFPTVDLTPPLSEHYARDFGGATLGIAVVLIAAVIAPLPLLVISAGLAYAAFAVPHFVFHAEHLDGATTGQAIFLVVGNGATALLGVLVVVLGVLTMTRDRRRALHDPALGGSAGRRRREPAGGDLRRAVP